MAEQRSTRTKGRRQSAKQARSGTSRSKSTTTKAAAAGRALARAKARRSPSKAQAIERLAAAEREIAGSLPKRELDALVDRAEELAGDLNATAEQSRPRSPLTGEELPGPRRRLDAAKADIARRFRLRRALLAETIGTAEVAELLDVQRQTPHDRVKSGSLLAVKERGQLRFPVWQFDPEGPDGVVEGLPEVLRSLEGPLTELGRMGWFLSPKQLLSGRSPRDALEQGDVEQVVAEARALGAS